MLALAVLAAGLPLAGLYAQACAPQPMPAPGSSLGWTDGNWPAGETIRFSARPSRLGRAYVVEIGRAAPAGDASVHLVRLVREMSCNRWDRDQEWTFPLGAVDADLFFERIGEIEARLRPDNEIVVDGTSFEYEHRRDGVTRRLLLSPTAMGETGQLSALILSLMRVARGEVPDRPGWDD